MTLTKGIEKLCQQASEEKDGDKLLSLVEQLNKELDVISEAPAKPDIAPQPPASTRHPEKNPNAA